MAGLPAHKTAEQLELTLGQLFRVVTDDALFPRGTVVKLVRMDDSDCPYFDFVEGNDVIHRSIAITLYKLEKILPLNPLTTKIDKKYIMNCDYADWKKGDYVTYIRQGRISGCGIFGKDGGVTQMMYYSRVSDVTVDNEVNELTNEIEGDTIMSQVTNDPVKAIMESELDADTSLLRAIGFETMDGHVTDTGTRAVVQSLYAERRAEFATKYRKALATEENAAKVANEAKKA